MDIRILDSRHYCPVFGYFLGKKNRAKILSNYQKIKTKIIYGKNKTNFWHFTVW